MNKNIGVTLIVAIVVGGAAFWGGMTYAQSQSPARGQGQFNVQFGQGAGTRGARAGDGGAFGKIISKDATSITVELTAGPNATSSNGTASGSKIVLYDKSTEVAKTVTGSASDLSVGTNVVVNGTLNSDGSITARMIQIRAPGTGVSGQRSQ